MFKAANNKKKKKTRRKKATMGKLKQKKIIRKCRRITHANESPVESAVVWFLKGRRDIEEVESGITKKKIQRKKREQHEREMDEKRLRKKRKKRR